MIRNPSARAIAKAVSWLLFFSTVPSRPVSKRMKVWRKLMQEGALHFKGAVYLLPYSEIREAMLQALTADVLAMGGDAAYVKAPSVETMGNEEIISLFNAERGRAYEQAGKGLHILEQKLGSMLKGGKAVTPEELLTAFRKIEKAYKDIAAVDFFTSEQGKAFALRLGTLAKQLDEASHGKTPVSTKGIEPKDAAGYRGRTWATRSRPFVDRMASAWLIRRFIDPDARFAFISETGKPNAGSLLFDVNGGEFTHHEDLCTFEVLMKAFGLKQRPLKKIAEIVHELDIKDGRYAAPEARGIEELLTGIRKTAKNDDEALEKGIAVFGMLYASQTS